MLFIDNFAPLLPFYHNMKGGLKLWLHVQFLHARIAHVTTALDRSFGWGRCKLGVSDCPICNDVGDLQKLPLQITAKRLQTEQHFEVISVVTSLQMR